MMTLKQNFLRGSYTPLITPFRDGRVDFNAFGELVDRQAREGSHGVVVAGTTGEPSSLTIQERKDLLRAGLEAAAGRLPVVAATGSQSYVETAELTRHAEEAGAHAVKLEGGTSRVTQIEAITQAGIPFMAHIGMLPQNVREEGGYKVKGRTQSKIAEQLPNLVGMKHAATDLEIITELLNRIGNEFRIFCGLEALSLPMLAIGAAGVMNAAGNLAPGRVAELCNAIGSGDLERARRVHVELFELNRAIFLDTNPIPLKYMMSRLGLLSRNEVRLPLVPITDAERKRVLDEVLEQAGLLVKEATA